NKTTNMGSDSEIVENSIVNRIPAPQSDGLPTLALGGATRTPIADTEHGDRIPRRCAIDVGGHCDGRADPLHQRLLHGEDPVEARDAHAHLVAGLHHLRGLGLLTVHAYMSCT